MSFRGKKLSFNAYVILNLYNPNDIHMIEKLLINQSRNKLKNEKVACSSKVSQNTVRMLDDLHNWSGMTKGELVDLAIADLHAKKKADKSLMIYIKNEEDRTFILNAVSNEYSSAFEKVLENIAEHYHGTH